MALFCVCCFITDSKRRETNARIIQLHGEQQNVWLPGWKPHGTTSLQDFLAEKIKTTLKKKRRIADVTQEEKSFLSSDASFS